MAMENHELSNQPRRLQARPGAENFTSPAGDEWPASWLNESTLDTPEFDRRSIALHAFEVLGQIESLPEDERPGAYAELNAWLQTAGTPFLNEFAGRDIDLEEGMQLPEWIGPNGLQFNEPMMELMRWAQPDMDQLVELGQAEPLKQDTDPVGYGHEKVNFLTGEVSFFSRTGSLWTKRPGGTWEETRPAYHRLNQQSQEL